MFWGDICSIVPLHWCSLRISRALSHTVRLYKGGVTEICNGYVRGDAVSVLRTGQSLSPSFRIHNKD